MQLREQRPYMIRNDGEIFECNSVHPYILHDIKDSFASNMISLVDTPDLDWFLNHSKQNIRSLIKDCLECLAGGVLGSKDSFQAIRDFGMDDGGLELLLRSVPIPIDPELASNVDDNYLATCKALWEELNNRMNQEFLRARMSDMYRWGSGRDIYFRVSSFDFNWFDIIWKIVCDNSLQINSITIAADYQAGKTLYSDNMVYVIDGKPVDHMDVEEFINLEGNPIVESYEHDYIRKLNKGFPLNVAIHDCGSFHNNKRYDAHRELYLKLHFVESKNRVER